MRKNITEAWLKKEKACSGEVGWFLSQKETDEVRVIQALISDGYLKWANWTLARRLPTQESRIKYAVYGPKQVLKNFEVEFPDDKSPRAAINAAKAALKDPSKKNKEAAGSAADAAAKSAGCGCAADADAKSAGAAARAAASAAFSATKYAAGSSESAMMLKILNYGLQLLKPAKEV